MSEFKLYVCPLDEDFNSKCQPIATLQNCDTDFAASLAAFIEDIRDVKCRYEEAAPIKEDNIGALQTINQQLKAEICLFMKEMNEASTSNEGHVLDKWFGKWRKLSAV